MPILNFGSCCIDHVYSVPHFAAPQETLACSDYQVHPGGKGLNQSIAMAAVGAKVSHAAKVGQDGSWLITLMASKNIDVSMMKVDTAPPAMPIFRSPLRVKTRLYYLAAPPEPSQKPTLTKFLKTPKPANSCCSKTKLTILTIS